MCIGGLASALRRIAFARRVVYMHGEEVATIDGYDDFRRRRRTVAEARRIVAVSRSTRDATARLLGRDAAADGRIVLTENGVDPRRFRSGAEKGGFAGVLRD